MWILSACIFAVTGGKGGWESGQMLLSLPVILPAGLRRLQIFMYQTKQAVTLQLLRQVSKTKMQKKEI